jgi:uncharacterized damage-inducible protein DinB
MKTMRAYYKECFESEKPRFLRVMKAVPADRASYRPDPRSSSAADIVWLLASELGDACEVVERGKVDYVQKPVPASVGESIAAFENNSEELERLLSKVDDAAWEGKAQFLMDGKVGWETTLGDMLFGFLFDAIHHRGQLSSYLRPMGAKVPSIYGPSADDPGA